MGDDRFVCRDDGLARTECRADERPGRLDTAHQLDDDVRLGIGDEVRRSVGQEVGRQAVAPALRNVAHSDRDDRKGRPIGRDEPVGVM